MLRGLKKKQTILKVIEENPGSGFLDIHNFTGFGHGVVSHHLNTLEKEGHVRINREKRNIWVFQSSFDPDDDKIVIALRKETCKKILLFLLESGSSDFSHIQNTIKKSPGTLSYTLKNLVEQDVVKIVHGFPKKYVLKDVTKTQELLDRLTVSNTDKLKDRFADTFSYL